MRSMGKDKGTLWGKRTVTQKSSYEHGGVDDEVGGGDAYRMQGM